MDDSKLQDAVEGVADAAASNADDATSSVTNSAAAGVAGASDAAKAAGASAKGLTTESLSGAMSSLGVNLDSSQLNDIMNQIKSGNLDFDKLKKSLGAAGNDLDIDKLKSSLGALGVDTNSIVSTATAADSGGFLNKIKHLLSGN